MRQGRADVGSSRILHESANPCPGRIELCEADLMIWGLELLQAARVLPAGMTMRERARRTRE